MHRRGVSSGDYGGFWVRFAAFIIDSILMTVVGSVLVYVTDGASNYYYWAINILYYVLLTGTIGQTIGKMVMGLKVINDSGEAPGIGMAFLREVPGKIISTVFLFLGYFWIVIDQDKQGWHDKIAGTYVVRI